MLDPYSFDLITGFRSEHAPKRRSWTVIACTAGLMLLAVYAWRLL